MSEQLSFLTAGYAGLEIADLAGVLCAGGRLVTRDDQASAGHADKVTRLSLIVPGRWRADLLLAEFATRGVGGEVAPTESRSDVAAEPPAGALTVRTDFTAALQPLARQWRVGASQRPPAVLALSGASLRLWVLAAGSVGPHGYLLGVADPHGPGLDPAGMTRLQAALAALGLPTAYVGPRTDGPGLRITSRRALRHLREYVGAAPPSALGWPVGR
ncbi:MAG: hypothetical protein ACR2F6_12550 [Mycobacteriales bacterium]